MRYGELIPLLAMLLFCGGCSILGTTTKEPSWRSVQKEGAIEIRDYAPMLVAEVVVSGEREEAINAGFRILADYIFGNNQAQSKIKMTTPVTQELGGASVAEAAVAEKIAMTAPVTQQAAETNNQWRVRFVMPAEYTIETLPTPNDGRVKILSIPAHRAAAIVFSGSQSQSNLDANLQKLNAWLKQKNITPIGVPVYAFYNPPWALPFLRRNEVMVKIPGA